MYDVGLIIGMFVICIVLLYAASKYFWKRLLHGIEEQVSGAISVLDKGPGINNLKSRIEGLEKRQEEQRKVLDIVDENIRENIENILSAKIDRLEDQIKYLTRSYHEFDNWAKGISQFIRQGGFGEKETTLPEKKPQDAGVRINADDELRRFIQKKGGAASSLLMQCQKLNQSSSEKDKLDFINQLFEVINSDDQREMESVICEYGRNHLGVSIVYAAPGKMNDSLYEMVGEKESSRHKTDWREKANDFRTKKGTDVKENEVVYVIRPTVRGLDRRVIQNGRAIVNGGRPS